MPINWRNRSDSAKSSTDNKVDNLESNEDVKLPVVAMAPPALPRLHTLCSHQTGPHARRPQRKEARFSKHQCQAGDAAQEGEEGPASRRKVKKKQPRSERKWFWIWEDNANERG